MTDTERGFALLTRLAADCAALFGQAMTGFYAHGSLTQGCFRWARGDLDFLLVTERAPTPEEKAALARLLLDASAVAPPKGLEMSAVRRADCRSPAARPRFDFHFSPLHAARCASDIPAYCRTMRGCDPDLPAHFAMTRARGRALYGPAPERVFAPVPRTALLESIRNDLAGGPDDAPGSFTLNLCRGLAFARDGLLLSKAEGADWAQPRYPAFAPVISAARTWYRAGRPEPDAAAARTFFEKTGGALK